MLSISELYAENLILLECVTGSNAYGLALAHSDIDKRGIFYAPRSIFYGLSRASQVNHRSEDTVFSEVGRFFELLIKNNPSAIELLNISQKHVIKRHSFFDEIKKEYYLSKLCKNTFVGYAIAQIKQAKRLSNKIFNPIQKERKTILDFCYVSHQQGSISIKKFLQENQIIEMQCGLSKISNMPNLYGLYVGDGYKGIMQGNDSNEVTVSQIEKNKKPLALMSFNKCGYSKYCREYRDYWEWVEKRNEDRHKDNLAHGNKYDSKNMMHVFRLLTMAEEIAKESEVKVHRTDRDFLLKIRRGEFTYDHLFKMAEEKMELVNQEFERCDLPDKPDQNKLSELLVTFRKKLY